MGDASQGEALQKRVKEALEAGLAVPHRLWNLAAAVQHAAEEWPLRPLAHLPAPKCGEELVAWGQEVDALTAASDGPGGGPGSYIEQRRDVLEASQVALRGLQDLVPLLEAVKHPALRERHLIEIGTRTGIELPLPPQTMPPLAELVELGLLRELKVIQSVAQLAEVSTRAAPPLPWPWGRWLCGFMG